MRCLQDKDGMLQGPHHNTLDCNASGTSPWIGTLYLAALKACEQMAKIVEDKQSENKFRRIWKVGVQNQNEQLWSENLGHYVEKSEFLEIEGKRMKVMTDATNIDMLLGQWWANQLNLGQLYPIDRTKQSLAKIYTNNKFTDTEGSGYRPAFRDFLGTGNTGWFMNSYPGEIPKNTILYHNEVMSGFEYAAASTMLQYGMLDEGLDMIKSISERYDGRFRGKGEVHTSNNSCVYGTGSPFGEDECGDFYTRAMSSWSALLALQGFIYDGPKHIIGFKPTWQAANHASFFTASNAWGLFTQTQKESTQTAQIAVKYGHTKIKTIVLAAPENKTGNDILVELDGIEQVIENTKQEGNSITIELKSSCEVKAGSALSISFNLKS